MQLSLLINNLNLKYAEFAWVSSLSAARQTVPIYNIKNVYLNTIVTSTIPGVSLSAGNPPPSEVGSFFTLPAGRYYFEADLGAATSGSINGTDMILGLYNNTLSSYVSRKQMAESYYLPFSLSPLNGMIELSSPSQFSVRFVAGREFNIGYGYLNYQDYIPAYLTTDADQRTTVKVWKLR
jgi:hypothetical protein